MSTRDTDQFFMLLLIACLVALFVFRPLFRKGREIQAYNAEHGARYNNQDSDSYFVPAGFTVVAIALLGFATIMDITSIAKMAINPTYYAIQNILQFVQ